MTLSNFLKLALISNSAINRNVWQQENKNKKKKQNVYENINAFAQWLILFLLHVSMEKQTIIYKTVSTRNH